MSLYQDRQIKGFLLFLTLFALLFVGTATVLTIYQVNDAEVLWLKHDEAVSSSLLEQGVPKEVVAVAFSHLEVKLPCPVYITNLIHASVDPKTVQYLAGHESSKITMDIYAKVKYNRPDELVRSMNCAFASWDAAQ